MLFGFKVFLKHSLKFSYKVQKGFKNIIIQMIEKVKDIVEDIVEPKSRSLEQNNRKIIDEVEKEIKQLLQRQHRHGQKSDKEIIEEFVEKIEELIPVERGFKQNSDRKLIDKLIKNVKQLLPEQRRRRQESNQEIIKTFPFVISLTIPGYTQQQRFFACNGFIIAKNWALTSKYCVEDKSYWRYVKVRSGSSYWSKGGYEHNVVDVVDAPQNGIVAIKVHPNFIFVYNPTDTDGHIKFITELDLQWSMALAVGFTNNLYELPIEKRNKFQMFTVDKYTTLPCPKSYTYKFCNKTDNVRFSGKPLVSECKHFLLGMEIIGKPNMFYDMNQKVIIDFVRNLVDPVKNPFRYKRSVQDNCTDLFKAYCFITEHFHCVAN